MSIRQQAQPNLVSSPKVTIFNRDDFNAALWQNGYDIRLEQAVACPCNTGSAPNPECSNCLGTGWVFVNPIDTRAFITSINRTTKYKDWSPEMVGTIAATFMNVDRISFMAKITLLANYSQHSETRTLRKAEIGGVMKSFIFCTYNVKSVESIFIFDGINNKLRKLTANEYSINVDNPAVIDLIVPANYIGKVSITYMHNMSYNVVDLPHDMRLTYEVKNSGRKEMLEMPIQCIARKSMYELGKAQNYEGTEIKNNSWL